MESDWTVETVVEKDLADLLPLLRAYCQFYFETEGIPRTSDELLLCVSQNLIANPQQNGIQLIVRSSKDQKAVGFATLFWTWSTLKGGRLAIMEDLYVADAYRGQGVADLLIGECERQARQHGSLCLTWQTSVSNHRAQVVYQRCGAFKSDRWLNYTLSLDDSNEK